MEETTGTTPLLATTRRDFRSLIIQILYAMESFEYTVSLESVIENFNRAYDMQIPLDGEVATIARAIINEREVLDETVKPLLANWRLERLGTCTRLVLRLALWELINTEIAATIIINEAIELAKSYSEKDAYKFINGILDEVAKNMEKHKKYDYKDLSSIQ